MLFTAISVEMISTRNKKKTSDDRQMPRKNNQPFSSCSTRRVVHFSVNPMILQIEKVTFKKKIWDSKYDN